MPITEKFDREALLAEITMDAVRLARSGNYLRADHLRQVLIERWPEVDPKIIVRAMISIVKRHAWLDPELNMEAINVG